MYVYLYNIYIYIHVPKYIVYILYSIHCVKKKIKNFEPYRSKNTIDNIDHLKSINRGTCPMPEVARAMRQAEAADADSTKNSEARNTFRTPS